MRYSQTTNCFYPEEIEYSNLPDDVIAIVDGEFEKCMSRRIDQTYKYVGNGTFELVTLPPQEQGVPQQVTKFQAKAALYLAGKLDAVEAIIADSNTERLTVLAWTEALHFERQSSMIKNMALILGMSDEEIDNLFITASQIN